MRSGDSVISSSDRTARPSAYLCGAVADSIAGSIPQRRRDLAVRPLQPKRHLALDAPRGKADVRPGANLVEQRLGYAARELGSDVKIDQPHHAPHDVLDGPGQCADSRRHADGQHHGQGHGHHEQGGPAAPTR